MRKALANFILGFRLEIRMMVECMDDNDGDIQGRPTMAKEPLIKAASNAICNRNWG